MPGSPCSPRSPLVPYTLYSQKLQSINVVVHLYLPLFQVHQVLRFPLYFHFFLAYQEFLLVPKFRRVNSSTTCEQSKQQTIIPGLPLHSSQSPAISSIKSLKHSVSMICLNQCALNCYAFNMLTHIFTVLLFGYNFLENKSSIITYYYLYIL